MIVLASLFRLLIQHYLEEITLRHNLAADGIRGYEERCINEITFTDTFQQIAEKIVIV